MPFEHIAKPVYILETESLETIEEIAFILDSLYFKDKIKEQSEPEPVHNDKNDKFEEIKKYKELLDSGIITQEEFEQKKKELLF